MNWKKTVVVGLITMFLLIFPPTRGLIWFLLPLGSGIDDLIFFIVTGIVVAILCYKAIGIFILTIIIGICISLEIDPEIVDYFRATKNRMIKGE